MTELLEKINSPEDLKKLSPEEKQKLCAEIRSEIIRVTAQNGGHLAPNLGSVELTVALYSVFSSKTDRIVFDVGHQTYAQKMLTGRWKKFSGLRKIDGISGFQNPKESPYDTFCTGHAGSALSSVMGLAAAGEDNDCHPGNMIAVVGDGSLGNGITLEALNSVRSHRKNYILVINDNKMSISKSVGTISNHLNRIITGRVYNKLKTHLKYVLKKLPCGQRMIWGIQKTEGLLKSLFVSSVFLEELGFKYVGPIDGHDLDGLITGFEKIRDIPVRPVAVHIITEKGHGCDYALASPETYHGVAPFDPQTGKPVRTSGVTFSSAFGNALIRLAQKDPNVIALTAAMAGGTGLVEFSKMFPDRFYDTGITEEHALVFAAGLAAGKKKPVIALYSTFLQRGLDCVFHDICLSDLPVVLCIDRAGVVEDGPTHHGIYDLGFLLAMPNLEIFAPRDEKDLEAMLDFAVSRAEHPVMIRYPRGSASVLNCERTAFAPGCADRVRQGKNIALWSVGRELVTALAVADLLEKKGFPVSVTDARSLKPLDEKALLKDASDMDLVTIEDCDKTVGLGALADRLLINAPHRKILHFGWGPGIVSFGNVAELRKRAGLDPEAIAEKIISALACA